MPTAHHFVIVTWFSAISFEALLLPKRRFSSLTLPSTAFTDHSHF
jgi:hypothetical protein